MLLSCPRNPPGGYAATPLWQGRAAEAGVAGAGLRYPAWVWRIAPGGGSGSRQGRKPTMRANACIEGAGRQSKMLLGCPRNPPGGYAATPLWQGRAAEAGIAGAGLRYPAWVWRIAPGGVSGSRQGRKPIVRANTCIEGAGRQSKMLLGCPRNPPGGYAATPLWQGRAAEAGVAGAGLRYPAWVWRIAPGGVSGSRQGRKPTMRANTCIEGAGR